MKLGRLCACRPERRREPASCLWRTGGIGRGAGGGGGSADCLPWAAQAAAAATCRAEFALASTLRGGDLGKGFFRRDIWPMAAMKACSSDTLRRARSFQRCTLACSTLLWLSRSASHTPSRYSSPAGTPNPGAPTPALPSLALCSATRTTSSMAASIGREWDLVNWLAISPRTAGSFEAYHADQ